MGTRARINVVEGNKILTSIYRQYDGYPDGLGFEISEFVKDMQMTNGIAGEPVLGETANGMGCLAAQLIKHLKVRVGGVYIRDTDPDSHGEEFVYNLSNKHGEIWLDVFGGAMTAFGSPGDSEAEMEAIWSGPARVFYPSN